MRVRSRALLGAALCAIVLAPSSALSREAPVAAPEIEATVEGSSAPVASAFVAPLASLPKATDPEPVIDVRDAQATGYFGSMKHVRQSLNNCGPAAVVMGLSTLGVDVDQESARIPLRGENVLRGMGPQGVPAFVSQWGLMATWRNNGTNALMKKLVSNGFAPMVTQWMQDPRISRIAHWRTVRGYDDDAGVFYVNDSMLGNGVQLGYQWFSDNWQAFSYRYMIIYRPEDEPKLRAIVGDDWSDTKMRENFYLRTKTEALARDDSPSWLAYGEASYQFGMFAEAVAAFDRGMKLGSANGVFTLRSSLPQALRALGRLHDADTWQGKLQTITPVPSTVAAEPDRVAVALFEQRARSAAFQALPFDALRLTP
jgi:hypothetical protein